ncbi:hypothetical protein B7P43_G12886 [Cryptotermes secundus]|uniref:Uncharacterized protein n=1 Tax=Cryptotermes secundus TaxID=105785 RepID=A0A2J7PVH8_9NEOP|nr:hypothetical protein B7P43_G12886 [Cryptotermes secundus]
MVACRDACPICDKPFYGKQKFIRCGVCEVRSHCACLQLGEAEQATLTAEGESIYKYNACANSSGIDMDPTNSPGSPSNEGANEGATSCASSNQEASPLIFVSNQLEAIRHNGQCIVQLIESLVDMVTNLAKEVAHSKNDNFLLKEEIRNLHSHVEASPRSPREQRILPVETSRKETASNQHMPSAALSTQASPAVPAGTTLSYRDIAVAGVSPPGPTALPDPDGFKSVRYRNGNTTSTPAASAVVNKVKLRRQPRIGISSSQSLPVVKKAERSKALSVSWFSPKVTADDVHKSLKEQLTLKQLVCTKLKTKFNSYSSFHISVLEDEFSLINSTGVWPSGCLIAPYYGKPTADQIFTASTPEAAAPAAAVKPAANPADNNGANGGSSTST